MSASRCVGHRHAPRATSFPPTRLAVHSLAGSDPHDAIRAYYGPLNADPADLPGGVPTRSRRLRSHHATWHPRAARTLDHRWTLTDWAAACHDNPEGTVCRGFLRVSEGTRTPDRRDHNP